MNRQLLLLRRVPLLRLNHVNKHLPFPSIFLPLESECQVKASSFYALRHFHGTLLANGVASKLNEAQSDVSEEIVDQSRKQDDKIEKPRKQEDNVDTSKPADYNPSTFDPSESRSIPSQKILQIVDEIANLTLLEASDLSYLLKKKLGLPDSAMPYYGGMGGGQGGGGSTSSSTAEEEEKKPEKTNFDIRLEKFDASAKIKVIKEVRTFTSLGLKEAKELVEKLPAILKKGVLKEEADQIIEKLKAIGASAVLE